MKPSTIALGLFAVRRRLAWMRNLDFER